MLCSFLLACSGTNAGQRTQSNVAFANEAALALALLFVGSALLAWWRTKRSAFVWPMGAMLLFHPAWTVSAIDGDCGLMKAGLAGLFLLVGVLLTFLHLRSALASPAALPESLTPSAPPR